LPDLIVRRALSNSTRRFIEGQ